MSDTDAGGDFRPTILHIDLDAIAENWRFLATQTAPAPCAAVVKADAYGLGAVAVVRTLAVAGCRLFFTAHLDEALALRALPECSEVAIAVLNGLTFPDEPAAHHAAGLMPVLNDLGQLAAWREHCRRSGPAPAILHLDSGMNRLGLPRGEAARLIADTAQLEGFPLRHIMSHLACSDTPEHPMNRRQLSEFRALLNQLPVPVGGAMLAASGGIFLGPEWHLDGVRPGIALYGGCPIPGRPNPMRGVIRLMARIIQLREIDAHESVGYGAAFTAPGRRRVATVAVGYGDGYLRSLGMRGSARIGTQTVPVLGRISMDLTTLDVSDVRHVEVGDMVEMIGPGQPIDALAREGGTISYEILTALGRRYDRRYHGAGVMPADKAAAKAGDAAASGVPVAWSAGVMR